MTKLEVIEARMRKLQAQAEALAKEESHKAITTIRQLMAEHGLSTADIDSHIGGKGRVAKQRARIQKSAGAAKYRDPKTGATWTGHGRAPGWIAGAKDRTKFLVGGAAAKAAARNAKRTKAPANAAGKKPLPALYRDPQTGATWSGRGRVPGWIADAEDRTAFRI